MKRPVRQNDGLFHLEGKTFKQLFGSREQVFNGTAYKTTGCLTKKNLHYNKRGRIVSLKKVQLLSVNTLEVFSNCIQYHYHHY